MGTRGIIGFITPEGVRGSYNHFDSYPTVLGKKVQAQLMRLLTTPSDSKDVWDWGSIAAAVRNIRWVDGHDEPTAAERKRYKAMTDATVSERGKDWYSVLRQTQGDLEAMLTHGIAIASHDFARDSLFCEWGYLLDLTTDEVVILRGFNTDEARQAPYTRLSGAEIAAQAVENPERFARDRTIYYGCREAWRGWLENFLLLDMEAFAEKLSAEEEEAEAQEEAADAVGQEIAAKNV
jgi:hypothetical protein